MDGKTKETSDINGKTICLIKKRGKVKALDEELHSKFKSIMPADEASCLWLPYVGQD